MLCNESLADEGGQVCVSAGKATDSLTLCFDPPPTATAPGSGAASPCLSEVTSSFGLQQSEGPSVSAGVEAGWLAEGCWQEGLAVYCVASKQSAAPRRSAESFPGWPQCHQPPDQ